MVRSQFSTSQHMVRRSFSRRSVANGSFVSRRSPLARRSVLMIIGARAALLARECTRAQSVTKRALLRHQVVERLALAVAPRRGGDDRAAVVRPDQDGVA